MQSCPTKSSVSKTDSNNHAHLIPCGDEKFQIDIFDKCQTKRNYLDLYVIGKIWVGALSTALVGEKVNIVPIVKATEPEPSSPSCITQKRACMKYTDLPLYQSQNTDLENGENNKHKCPDSDVKIVHKFLLPYVKCCRSCIQEAYSTVKDPIITEYERARNAIDEKRNEIIAICRDPDKIAMRYAVVAIGGITGYALGARIRRRLLFTSIGLLAGGAMCFPKETDYIVRNIAFTTKKTCISLYNKLSGEELNIRDKIACKDDLPSLPDKK